MQDECVPLLAGVGVREITPTPEMIDASLHRTMSVRLDEVGAPLLAKALALTQGDTQVMLVALDLCLVMTDQAELARLGHVSRARLTQIMNLLHLAPDIQEEILFLPLTKRGRDSVTERELRPIAAMADWRKQRQWWKRSVG